MKTRHDFPQYLASLQAYMNGKNQELTRLMRHPKLSQIEKKLLTVRLYFKKNQYNEAHKILLAITSSEYCFFMGERAFLFANYHCFLGQWAEARQWNQEALQNYSRCGDTRGLFLSHYNLSVDHSRNGFADIEDEHLRQAQSYAQTHSEVALILRAQASRASKKGDSAQSLVYLEKAFQLQTQMSPVDQAHLLMVGSDIYFAARDYEKALETLQRLRQCKTARDRARIALNYTLVKKWVKYKSDPCNPKALHQLLLPVPPKAVTASLEFQLKWHILQAIQQGERDQSRKMWSKLATLLPTEITQQPYNYSVTEETSIFIQFLRLCLVQNEQDLPLQTADKLPSAPSYKGKLARLYRELKESPTPLRKETLIEAIWGTPYHPHFDSRFYKLLERLKKNQPVVSINRAYRFAVNEKHA